MASDLMKFIKPQWVFRSETAGDWDVYYFSMNAVVQVEKYSSGEISDPIEAVRSLIGVMCKNHTDNQENDGSTSTKPTVDDLTAFTEEDINGFSRQFLEYDSSLDTEKELDKVEGQSDAVFFLKVLEAKSKKQSAEMRDMLSSQNSSISGLLNSKNSGIRDVSESLLKQSKGIESYYSQATLIPNTFPELLNPPPNPIHETNDRLGDMAGRLENLVGFGESAIQIMNGLQVASAEFLENFSTEAEKNSKAANKAIWVGIFAVLFSVAQIGYTEFWRVPQDTAAMDAALASVRGEIDELQTALGADLARFQTTQVDTAVAVADSVKSTGATNKVLIQRIDLLLQQQMVRGEAIIEALGAISETARNPAD